jgi:hypothetical protein
MLNLFKIRKRTSLFDRQFYSLRLEKVLETSKLADFRKVYLLTNMEANSKNLVDIDNYINSSSYIRLSFIGRKLPFFEGPFGDTIKTDLYQMYLMIDNSNNYYLVILHIFITKKHEEELIYMKSVAPFFYQFFCNRRLVYPIEIN